MANINNPRKDFNFSIQIVPLPINPWLVQEVIIPESAHDEVSHGDVNYDVKTAGRTKYSTVKMKKISTTDGADNYIWDWHQSCNDTTIGGGLPPSLYKRTMTVTELAEDGTGILNTWLLTGVWPQKINEMTLNRKGEDNTIESVDFCVDRIEKL